jgi:hypothetical protein
MLSPLGRLLALVLPAVVALALIAGCGGDDVQDRTRGLSAAELLEQSADAARDLDSFRISLDAEGGIDLRGATGLPGANLLDGPLEVSAEGPVAPPDRASLDASIRVSGLPLQLNVTRVEDEVFVGALGQDFRLAIPPEQVSMLDLGGLYPALAGWTTDPVRVGEEEVGGVPTVRVAGDVHARRALSDLAPLLGGSAPSAADARAALRRGRVESWIGTEDLLPRRVRLTLRADGSRVARGVGEVALDMTVLLSAFDEPVEIVPPESPRTLDPGQLGALFGG